MKIASMLPKPRFHESVKNRYHSYLKKIDGKPKAKEIYDPGPTDVAVMDVEADELDLLPAELDGKSFRLGDLNTLTEDRKTALVGELRTLVKTRRQHNATLSGQIDTLTVKIQLDECRTDQRTSCD
ncbi:MAG: hypothetical protein V2I33_19530 [Kangiellaceae bacterium]|jgi:hypothetical protein|nr:hypothetical protein [Kangiellaceae bacterium]